MTRLSELKESVQRRVDHTIANLVRKAHQTYFWETHRPYAKRWHPHYAMLQDALAETVEYIKTNMPHAMIKENAYEVLTHASGQVEVEGLFLEFGVRTGSTINHLARENPNTIIYGFDSFEGLPEPWSGWTHEKGTFGGEGIPDVEQNARLIRGWFDDSLPPFVADHQGDLALAHIDSDLYSSARTVLHNLAARIRPGTVLVFNEYFNYPNWKEHEYRAFQEFCETHAVDYEYLCWGMFEVAVKILAIEHDA